MKLKDKTIVVSGGAGGIGRAVLDRCFAYGANVAVLDTDEGKLAALKASDRMLTFAVDVRQRDDIAQALDAVVARWGALNGLVNNAAIVRKGDIASLTEEDLDAVYAVNLKGYFLLAQEAVRRMAEGAAIVNMSSLNGMVAIPDQTAYSMMKGAVNQLTRAMALSLAPRNIRANAVAPGSIATELFRAVVANPEALRTVLSRTPLGRAGEPAEVAELTAFLLSHEASYITGEIINIDGGRTALNYTVPVDDV